MKIVLDGFATAFVFIAKVVAMIVAAGVATVVIIVKASKN